MVMELHAFKIKAVVALMLVLCLVMSFMFSAASAFVMATHTHICYDDEYKESCVDVRECCKICLNFYGVKNRTQTLCGNIANRFSATPVPSLVLLTTDYVFLCINSTTLVSLKIRLNN